MVIMQKYLIIWSTIKFHGYGGVHVKSFMLSLLVFTLQTIDNNGNNK